MLANKESDKRLQCYAKQSQASKLRFASQSDQSQAKRLDLSLYKSAGWQFKAVF